MDAAAPTGAGDAILLGAIQGLTEFLPISSSGHLVLAQKILGWQEPAIAFDVLLHLGTLLSILFVFRREIARMIPRPGRDEKPFATSEFRLFLLVCLATLPTGVIAMSAHTKVKLLFGSTLAVGIALIGTAAVLAATRLRSPDEEGRVEVRVVDALVIGAVQGIAVLPGLSRSGTTIATALLLGIEGAAAARFSFLLAVPAILGAAVVEGPHDLAALEAFLTPAVLAGAACAAVVGTGAILVVVRIARVGRVYLFAPYCLAVGLGAIAYSQWSASGTARPALPRLAMDLWTAIRHLL